MERNRKFLVWIPIWGSGWTSFADLVACCSQGILSEVWVDNPDLRLRKMHRHLTTLILGDFWRPFLPSTMSSLSWSLFLTLRWRCVFWVTGQSKSGPLLIPKVLFAKQQSPISFDCPYVRTEVSRIRALKHTPIYFIAINKQLGISQQIKTFPAIEWVDCEGINAVPTAD